MAESKNQLLRKVKAEVVELSGDEEVRRLEELKDKWERDYKSGVSYAMEQGMKKGLREGLEQGKKYQSIEIAKKMLERNKTIEEIMEITELTKQEIEKIKNK